MKRILLVIIPCLLVFTNLWAQDETSDQIKVKDEPVGAAFENSTLIDAQTSVIPDAKSLEFTIQHKFGSTENGIEDLFGIMAPGATVRLGLNYVPVKDLQIGIGTRSGLYTDLNAKWTIFKQTQNSKMPFFVTVYGNVAADCQPASLIGSRLNNYGAPADTFGVTFNHRLSYFTQLIIGRKFSDRISLQTGVSFSHANLVDQYHDHDRVGLHLSGRVKFSPQSSLIFTYDAPLKIADISEQHPNWNAENAPGWDGPYNPKPSLKFGVEVSTFTHAFQIYMGNASGILPQFDMMNNTNDLFDGLAFGFTITRLWMW